VLRNRALQIDIYLVTYLLDGVSDVSQFVVFTARWNFQLWNSHKFHDFFSLSSRFWNCQQN